MIEDWNKDVIKSRFKKNFEPPEDIEFNNEKDFQIWLAKKLINLGFKVYLDKKICEDIPTFHGDKEKPDLLVFFNHIHKDSKIINIQSPFAIETKFTSKNNKFNCLSRSILQIEKYHGKEYYTENWRGKISNIFLATDSYIFKNKIYHWELSEEFYEKSGIDSFHCGLAWGLIRILFNISNKSGFIGYDGEHFTIEIPNSFFYFLDEGRIGYKPNEWNNFGEGYD